MEDAHISKPDMSSELSEAGIDGALKSEQMGLFAVFDGHGGKEVARFCEEFFIPELIKTRAFAEGDFGTALTETFHRMDEMLELPVRHDIHSIYLKMC
jgi:serine/threonine protein phosphatase PrpC